MTATSSFVKRTGCEPSRALAALTACRKAVDFRGDTWACHRHKVPRGSPQLHEAKSRCFPPPGGCCSVDGNTAPQHQRGGDAGRGPGPTGRLAPCRRGGRRGMSMAARGHPPASQGHQHRPDLGVVGGGPQDGYADVSSASSSGPGADLPTDAEQSLWSRKGGEDVGLPE